MFSFLLLLMIDLIFGHVLLKLFRQTKKTPKMKKGGIVRVLISSKGSGKPMR